ncbi:hypothetical protein [Saliphagus infecundisoli]|uniref:Metal-dependent hydrolase n=1 Tax=Saliphagus infecundisoli TaxID=1849069 RepID=A0ABD5QFX0_9EURY|nr:hypothetical protein [Saliphagus infecundisoli]
MLFPTHLLAAALLSRVTRLPAAWLVVGAAVPDLVDKPLGVLGVTALFHSVGHSLVLAVVVVPIALSGRAGLAVATGWASHLALDVTHVVVNGRPADALFAFWPLISPPDPLGLPPGAFVGYYLGSPAFFIEVAVWTTLAAVALRSRLRARRADAG